MDDHNENCVILLRIIARFSKARNNDFKLILVPGNDMAVAIIIMLLRMTKMKTMMMMMTIVLVPLTVMVATITK